MESRLSRNLEKKTRNKLVINIIGILIVLFLLIKFGIPLLINFSLFLSGAKGNSPTANTNTKSFIAPPTLTSPFTATNSATITVNGASVAGMTIKLFVNDALVDSAQTQGDGTFSFANVSLQSGNNTIKAKATKGNSESDFSDTEDITYTNKAPALSVDAPSDGQSFSGNQNTAIVKGKTDADVHVTVNGFWATSDAGGNYSYTLQLQNGDNHITVDATDTAGNKTEKTLTIHYSQ